MDGCIYGCILHFYTSRCTVIISATKVDFSDLYLTFSKITLKVMNEMTFSESVGNRTRRIFNFGDVPDDRVPICGENELLGRGLLWVLFPVVPSSFSS